VATLAFTVVANMFTIGLMRLSAIMVVLLILPEYLVACIPYLVALSWFLAFIISLLTLFGAIVTILRWWNVRLAV
jgi:hypothetical protein